MLRSSVRYAVKRAVASKMGKAPKLSKKNTPTKKVSRPTPKKLSKAKPADVLRVAVSAPTATYAAGGPPIAPQPDPESGDLAPPDVREFVQPSDYGLALRREFLTPSASMPSTVAIAIDVEFMKVAASVDCRSVAIVPFILESPDSSAGSGIISSLPPPGVASKSACGRLVVPAEFHIVPEVVMRNAATLPAGHALAELAASADAQRLFGRVLHPYTIPNPERYRHIFRRLIVETASAGTSRDADLRIDALTSEVRGGLIPFVRKVAERESLDAVLDALRDPLRVAEACDALDAFHALSADAVSAQALSGGATCNAPIRAAQAQPVLPSPQWALLPSLRALGHACHTRIAEITAEAKECGQADSVIVLAYGDGDEAPFLRALDRAAPSFRAGSVVPEGTEPRPRLGACTHVMNLHKHPNFPAAMSALGLRPVPKLVEVFAALTNVSGAVGDEARTFAALTLGVSANHNALWDAQVLALVARFVHGLEV